MSDIQNSDDGFRNRVAIVSGNTVISIADDSPYVINGVVSNTAQIGDVWDASSNTFLSPDAYRASLRRLIVQQRLDAFARAKGYAGIDELCSSQTEDAAVGIAVQNNTWAAYAAAENEIADGSSLASENPYDIESELPVLSWAN